jgi:molybdopterin molybdotransferase
VARQSRAVLSVEEALASILAEIRVLSPVCVPVLEALDRVLAEEIAADRDIPPLTNSAMDGFAIRAAELQAAGPVRLAVVDEVPAGKRPDRAVSAGQAMRIMTGAPVPDGADTVVRFEDTRSGPGWVEVLRPPRPGANVRHAGEDVRAGQVVLRPNKLLRPQEIGMLSALGCLQVAVHRRPRVAVLPTGDEVVPPTASPGPGQIRDANSYTLAALVLRYGGVPLVLDVARDEEALVRERLRRAAELETDLILTSGGVSVGPYDLVKRALASEGEMRFWSLNMKPGRPMAFGIVHGIPLLGLPGNPVAAMVSAELFARPALLKMQGFRNWDRATVTARLRSAIERKDGRRHYLRVRLIETGGGLEAELTGDQGSGILYSLVAADGLAIIGEEHASLPRGSSVPVIPLH